MNKSPSLTHSRTHALTHSPLGWILMILALVTLVGISSLGSGCATLGLIGTAQKEIKKSLKVEDVPADASPVKKLEAKMNFYLGIGAGLAVLAILAGGIILVWKLIHGTGWKTGGAIFGGGILAICGIYSVAVVIPILWWVVIVVLIIICVALVTALCWIGYQVFVEKRAFNEVVTCFQRKKNDDWDRETIDFMNKNQTPETRKLVREVKATLPKPALAPGVARIAEPEE